MGRKISVEIVGDYQSLNRSFKGAGNAARTFDRDLGKTARGAVAASLSFRGLGRAAAYASGYLIAGGGLVVGLKAATTAAIDHQAAEAQLAAAVKHSGASYASMSEEIDNTLLAQRRLSGFTEEETVQSFTKLLRTTNDVGKALHYNQLAMEIARGANIDLGAATNVVNKTLAGQTTGLRRLGVQLPKGVSGYRALQIAGVKYGGSLAAWSQTAAGKQALLAQAIHQTEVTIGTALLPTISRLSGELADWLNKSGNQERIQRDVNKVVKDATTLFRDAAAAAKKVSGEVGGFRHVLQLLLELKLVSALAGWASNIGLLGESAATSTTKVTALRGALTRLGAVGAITIAIDLAVNEIRRTKAIEGAENRTGGQQLMGDKFLGHKLGDKPFVADKGAFKGQNVKIERINGQLWVVPVKPPKPHADRGFRSADLTPAAVRRSALSRAGIDRLSQIQDRVAAARAGVARKTPGAQAQLSAALKEEIAFDRKYEAIQAALVAKGGKDAKKHAQTLQALYADETSSLDEINNAQNKALSAQERAARKAAALAKKRREAEKKRREAEKKAAAERLRLATTFTVPMSLQIAAAKAATTISTADDIAIAKKIKAFSEETIKSGKKKGQALVDAWNEIAGQLQIIGQRQTSQAVAVSSTMLTAGLNLSRAQRKALEARYAQASAHSGHVSAGVGVDGQTVVIDNHVHLDGQVVARSTTKHQQRDGRHSAVQVRGPHAGRNPRVH